MTRQTIRVLTCDVSVAVATVGGTEYQKCTARFIAEGKLYWPVVQARAREAGWKHTGDRHRCPAHRHHPFEPWRRDEQGPTPPQ